MPEKDKPLVSISCITYNQAPFIKQCIDSFLMQRTNFKFEILVHDDASTDGTAEIIKEYEAKYPGIIRPIYEKENQWVKGRRGSIIFNFPRAKGKYLALCEGDDYWTDPQKLQLQVDFLESHPDYALCFHPVVAHFENNEEKDCVLPSYTKKSKFTVRELLKGNFIQTNSVMYRKQEYKRLATDVLPADWYLHLYHAQFGKIGFINKAMSVYRRHAGGVWWESYNNHEDFVAKYWRPTITTHNEILKMYGSNKDYKNILDSSIIGVLRALLAIDKKKGSKLFNEAIGTFPDNAVEYIKRLQKTIVDREKEIHQINFQLAQKDQEIINMVSSKSWKVTKPLRTIYKKFTK